MLAWRLIRQRAYPAARAADFICRRLLIENFLRSCVLMIKQRWNHLTGKQHTGTPRGRRKAAESSNGALSVLSGRKGKIFKINKVPTGQTGGMKEEAMEKLLCPSMMCADFGALKREMELWKKPESTYTIWM